MNGAYQTNEHVIFQDSWKKYRLTAYGLLSKYTSTNEHTGKSHLLEKLFN